MPINNLQDTEQQLTARRLDVQNLKVTVANLQGQINTLQTTLTTVQASLTALQNAPAPVASADGVWNGTAVLYRLASLFSAVVTFSKNIILSFITTAGPLHASATGMVSSGPIDLSNATTTDVTNILPVPNGGTGLATISSGDYLKGNGAGAISVQAAPIPVSDGGTGNTSLGASGVLVGNGTSPITVTATLAVNGSKLGFFGGSLTVQQATIAYSSDPISSAFTGIASGVAGTPYAQLADLNTLRVGYETLRIMAEDLRTKIRSTGFIQ